jgi:hypothetical protein
MMRLSVCALLTLVAIISYTHDASADVGTLADGTIVAWGDNSAGQLNVPTGFYTAIAAGYSHAVAMRNDGTLVGWGTNTLGQATPPSGEFLAIASGGDHSLGVRTNGSIVGWGANQQAFMSFIPSGTFTSVAAGSNSNAGLRADGNIIVFGTNGQGQQNVPPGTYSAVADGGNGSDVLAIRSDGTLAAWGQSGSGQLNVPSGTFTAIAEGESFDVAIDSNGALFGWGLSGLGQTNVPAGTYRAVAAGYNHGLAIKTDGTLAGWGSNGSGQTTVPSGVFSAVSGGNAYSLGLRTRTSYSGDIVVSYAGDPGGANRSRSTLDRSITVAGNATIKSTMYMEGSALMSVAGKVTFAPGGGTAGYGTISAAGGLEILSGELLFVPSSLTLSVAGPLMGGGDLYVYSGGHVTAAMTDASSYTGNLYVDDASALNFTGTGFVTPATVNVYAGGDLRLSAGQRMQATGGGSNAGLVEALGSAAIGGEAELEFGAAFTNAVTSGRITGRNASLRFDGDGLANSGAVSLTGGVNDVYGMINNSVDGKLIITGGATATFYDNIVQNGSLRVSKSGSTTSVAIFLGSVSGAGGSTGGGDIFFEGGFSPGNSPAAVSLDGPVTFGDTNTLAIELGGTTLGTQYDHVAVTGDLALGGVLQVLRINGFNFAAGQSFDILDWGNLSGAFSTLQLPTLADGLTWNTSQLYTSGVLSVGSVGLPGDFNHDGTVNAADYVTWRKGLGTIYTQSDYDVWRAHYGQSASGSGVATAFQTTVPEPLPALLLLSGAIIVVAKFRGRTPQCGRR